MCDFADKICRPAFVLFYNMITSYLQRFKRLRCFDDQFVKIKA